MSHQWVNAIPEKAGVLKAGLLARGSAVLRKLGCATAGTFPNTNTVDGGMGRPASSGFARHAYYSNLEMTPFICHPCTNPKFGVVRIATSEIGNWGSICRASGGKAVAIRS